VSSQKQPIIPLKTPIKSLENIIVCIRTHTNPFNVTITIAAGATNIITQTNLTTALTTTDSITFTVTLSVPRTMFTRLANRTAFRHTKGKSITTRAAGNTRVSINKLICCTVQSQNP
jgi:hypothetical protein